MWTLLDGFAESIAQCLQSSPGFQDPTGDLGDLSLGRLTQDLADLLWSSDQGVIL